VVEHWLPKPGVAGSTPVVRSKYGEGPRIEAPRSPVELRLPDAGRSSRAHDGSNVADCRCPARRQAVRPTTTASCTRPAGRAVARGHALRKAFTGRGLVTEALAEAVFDPFAGLPRNARAERARRDLAPADRLVEAPLGPARGRAVFPDDRVAARMPVLGSRQRSRRHKRCRVHDTTADGHALEQPPTRDSYFGVSTPSIRCLRETCRRERRIFRTAQRPDDVRSLALAGVHGC
jgi:hypothetical protein